MSIKRSICFLTILCMAAFLHSCSPVNPPKPIEEQVEEQLREMNLMQKVCQLFFVRPEALDFNVDIVDPDQMVVDKLSRMDDKMIQFCQQYPVGGICLYKHNIIDQDQLSQFTTELHGLPFRPLLCVDEEGGRVARIASNEAFGLHHYSDMETVAKGGSKAVYDAAYYIGTYVRRYGIDIDFAPVADVNTNAENIVIGSRAFSDNPDVAAQMVTSFLTGLWDADMYGCVKHFPGHGDVKGDTHTGYVATQKNWAQMLECEMVTFRAAIRHGVRMIMTAHIAAPAVTGSVELPATMSDTILNDKLRGELGYKGIIITDAMEMGAITQHYTSAEAAVGTIKAGADIVLMPQNLREAVRAVYEAVKSGEISESRIDESVRRIMRMKYSVKD